MPSRHHALLAGFLCSCATAPAPVAEAPLPAVREIAAAAARFLQALPPEQRALALRSFDDPERTTWAFVPGRYAGVEIGALDENARALAQDLLRALLSAQGYAKATAIVELEAHLQEIESRGGRDASHRDPGRYALLICGEPRERSTFAVRMQGHHLSLHFTFANGVLAGATPQFLGSNPHERREGTKVGQRVLGAEEDLARELLQSLHGEQLLAAVIDSEAPADVLLRPGVPFDALGQPAGLAASAMSAAQRAQLRRLVELLVRSLRGELAEPELMRLEPELAALRFAWAGSSVRGEGHYWRIHGQSFAIEYDNTQDDANHVHVVWRDLTRDFGADLRHPH